MKYYETMCFLKVSIPTAEIALVQSIKDLQQWKNAKENIFADMGIDLISLRGRPCALFGGETGAVLNETKDNCSDAGQEQVNLIYTF